MPRIRSIHPTLWTDEAYMEASFPARLLLLGLWTEAFDDGVFSWKPVVLKARLFPADSCDCDALLAELCSLGFICRFEAAGKAYGAIRNFQKFQRPKKPNESGHLPDDLLEFVAAGSRDEDPTRKLRRELCEDQGDRCYYCNTAITHYAKRHDSMEIDHKQPRSKGGADTPDNLAATCRRCNRSKGNMSESEFRDWLNARNGATANAKTELAFQMEDGGEDGKKEKEDISSDPDRTRARKSVSGRKPYPDDFEAFWKAYPTDKLMSKLDAGKAWAKLCPEDRLSAAAGVPGFRAHCKANPDYRPVHACRFLTQRRFEGFAPSPQARGDPLDDEQVRAAAIYSLRIKVEKGIATDDEKRRLAELDGSGHADDANVIRLGAVGRV